MPMPRRHRSPTWLFIGVTLLLFTGNAATWSFHAFVFRWGLGIGVGYGAIMLWRMPDGDYGKSAIVGSGAVGVDWSHRLWPRIHRVRGGLDYASLPLWIPATIVAVPAFILWRRDRRLRAADACRHCRYDLRGLPQRPGTPLICPECGAAAPADRGRMGGCEGRDSGDGPEWP